MIGHELVHAFQFDHDGLRSARVGTASAPEILAVSAVVCRGHGRIPHARRGRSADGDVAAGRGDARNAAAHSRPRRPEYFPVSMGDTRSGRSLAPSTAIARWRRCCGRRPIPAPTWSDLRVQLGTDPDSLTAEWHAAIARPPMRSWPTAPPLASDPRRLVSRDDRRRPLQRRARDSVPTASRSPFSPSADRFSVDLVCRRRRATGQTLRRLSSTPATIRISTASSS